MEGRSADGPPAGPGGGRWLRVAAAAAVLTALNAVEPVHIDDPVNLTYGAEFAAHPLDPYAFEFGSPLVHPANDLLVPPVLAYWLGVGQAVLGDRPALLKVWLLPFALLLAWAVDFLAARAAPSLRAEVFWLGVLSPTVLPGFNLMVDVPAAALGLAAVAAAVRAAERGSAGLAVVAGVLAGVAVQAKYTGAVPAAAVVLWFVLRRRPGLAAAAGATALAVAVGWEGLVARAQGESHFLIHFRQRQGKPVVRGIHLMPALASHAAGLAPAVGLLGMAALGWGRRAVLGAGLAVAGGVAALALVPSQQPLLTAADGKPVLTPSNLVYGALAVAVLPPLVGVCLRLARAGGGPGREFDWFLLGWLALDVLAYFAISPYPAARRLTGPLMVLTLVAGRAADRAGVPRRTAGRLAACGAALAVLVQTADVFDARADREAARRVAHAGPAPAAGGTYWHLSWMGFGYYADREGLRAVRLNRELPRPGDLVAVLDAPEFRAFLAGQRLFGAELVDTVEVGDRFPLRAAPGYYDGRTPLEHNPGVRVRVLIYRVTAAAPAN